MCHWMFKSCASGLHKLSKFILYFTNFIFAVLGVALIALSSYARLSDWSRFFHGSFLTWSLVAGVIILLVSFLGCAGVRTGKKRYLCPYTTFVLVCCALQVVAFALTYNFNGAMDKAKDKGFDEEKYDDATNKVMDYIRDQFIHVYEAGDCNTASSTTCAKATWLADFINTDCADSSANVTSCTAGYNGNNHQANKEYCSCRASLRSKIEQVTGPLSYAAIAFAAFEFVLVVMACCLMCHDREEERLRKELEQQDPAYAGQSLEASSAYIDEERQAQQRAANRGHAAGAGAPNLV